MDRKGFKAVEKAIEDYGHGEVWVGRNRSELEKDEECAFIEVYVYSAAGILNGLHETGLLASNANLNVKGPRLELVSHVENTMTFLDVNADRNLTMATLRGQ